MPEMFDNRYEIVRRLGSGGMADVYLAKDTHLGRNVAIKVLYKRYARDDEFVARFRHEAHAAAALNHPHIVSIYDRGEAEGSYYIAMEYLEGQSLKEFIGAKGQLEPAHAVEIGQQILQALQFAHEHNVIHRDIKPHNIVINGRGQVKVTDFGIARAGSSARMTETGSIIGTAQYLSPEQAKGQAVERGSDLYSLGVVLYEMLTGRVPFDGENPVAIALKHLSDEPVPPQALVPEIPDNLNAVVMRALAKSPHDRYATADEFMGDLERCRNNLPVAAPLAADDTVRTGVITPAAAAAMMGEPSPETEATVVRPGAAGAPPAGKPGRKKKYLYILIILAALALAAAGVYMLASAQKATVEVPDVVGLDRQQAEDTLKAQKLETDIEAEEYSDTVPEGRVIRQNPEAGSKLKEGGSVRLVVSRGSGRVAVPDIVGQTASYAESKLREAGLVADRQPDAYSETVPEGNVISQDPAAGAPVQRGSPVKYVVSKGPEPAKEVNVPSLVGLTQAAAEAQLAAAKLVLGNVTEQYSSTVPAGEVMSQNPAAGQKVGEGSAVSITVSKGPEPPATVTVPPVVGQTQANAQTQLAGAGFVVFINYVPAPDPSWVGRVVSQSPLGGSEAAAGSDVTIDVGA